MKSLSELYGQNVFNLKMMRKHLKPQTFKKLQATINEAKRLDSTIAHEVADAMKKWAIARNVTHYTHWFQPLTGSTAEKHDSFADPDGQGGVLMKFSGKALIQGEPDASSFPSGGIRSTFEARGYTAWDPTSPAFIRESEQGSTLFIPTAFCSYTGEALDMKTPLLRSLQALSRQAQRLLKCFKDKDAKQKILVFLGAEQEYFLVDKELYLHRPDLLQTGRTLIGAVPAKHQQLEDHYFGSIRARVINFMSEADRELWKLGIPAKTRHLEVAPGQFEIAPTYEELNLAVDHNMLTMDVLRQVAEKHGLVCLLHEKPFQGVNGSGKHNNWSLGTEKRNFLNPGKTPHDNALFLAFLCAILRAVDRHAGLLRASVASAGNDHRLGANEAPPAVISVFLGDQLTHVLDQLEKGDPKSPELADMMHIGVNTLPPLPKDATDRNRTSPFAFTGNKFEFRAVGSHQSCAPANIVLNTIVAESIDELASTLEQLNPKTFNQELQAELQKIIRTHKRIIFNGDNYSATWLEEASRRGLPHFKNTREALVEFSSKKSTELFEKYSVLTKTELHSRQEIYEELFHKTIVIESKMLLEMVQTMVLPATYKQAGLMAEGLEALESATSQNSCKNLKIQLKLLGENVEMILSLTEELKTGIKRSDLDTMIQTMEKLRAEVDAMELLVEDTIWPLPKYRELLFME